MPPFGAEWGESKPALAETMILIRKIQINKNKKVLLIH